MRERKKRKEKCRNCASSTGCRRQNYGNTAIFLSFSLTVVLPCFQQTTSQTQREGSLYRECKHCTGSGKHIIFTSPKPMHQSLFNSTFELKKLLLQTYTKTSLRMFIASLCTHNRDKSLSQALCIIHVYKL